MSDGGKRSRVQGPPEARQERIAALNDAFRRDHSLGDVLFTREAVLRLGDRAADLLTFVAEYVRFDEINNADGERNNGSIKFRELEIIWSIDYYDLDGVKASKDPANSQITTRLMLIMMASEYI